MTATMPRRDATEATSGSPVLTYYLLIAATAILVTIGLSVVLSSTAPLSIRRSGGNPYALFAVQAAALAMGVAAIAVGSRLSIRTWKRIAPWALYGSVGLLVLVVTHGVASGGNRNWLHIGGISIQPSEVAKVGLALYLGVVLAMFRHELTTLKRIVVPGGIAAGIVLGLILMGRDMGTAVVVVLMVAAAYLIAGLPMRFFGVGAGLAVIAAIPLLASGNSRSSRIDIWLNPENCDRLGACMQSIHGQWALASGGLWGLGPGASREKWGYLPTSDSDFIFSIVGEEFGLVGTLLVLCAFGMIAVSVNRIVQRHTDPFVKITAAALGAWIVGQAFINIAVVLGLLPVTGVPLPLVSSGGSSLVMSLVAMGILVAFARTEPGAAEAFAARPSVIRRSIAVISRGRRG